MNTEILTVKEVAEYLKMNSMTIYRMAKVGKIPAFKLGGDWRFRRSSIDEWIIEKERNNGNGNHHPAQMFLKEVK